MHLNDTCPSCGAGGMTVFYEVNGVPTNSVLLLNTREEALNYPQGDIALAFCRACGFIANIAFEPRLTEYSGKYEATQAFSPTFNAFHRSLAAGLINRYDLHGKDVIEIGCGQGEFLTMLCELGGNRGVGFDPAYRPNGQAHNQITLIPDFYSERYIGYASDFLCCKMTLEHIQPVAEFIRTVRRSIGERPNTVIFFQVPNGMYVLRDVAFWDVYYEHCSYFTAGALGRLFRRSGFNVLSLWTDYDDQYLMVEAKPGSVAGILALPQEEDMETLAREVRAFAEKCRAKLAVWRERLAQVRANGWRAVIWGGGSKGVSFLTTLNIRDEIGYAVDVNPNKHGTYMAGAGQQVVGPAFLKEYHPEIVIVMNPIYCPEIQRELDRMGVRAQLWPLD